MERAGLAREEAYALLFNNLAWWHSYSQQILRVSELAAEERSELDGFILGQYASGEFPTARVFYDLMRPYLNRDAVRYIDNLLAQSTFAARTDH